MPRSKPRQRLTLIEGEGVDPLAAFARDVCDGLQAKPKRLNCCYFYDREGSLLFEAICRLPEYYLTRAEHEILSAWASEIAAAFTEPVTLVELGSGSGAKTRLLIDEFLRRQHSLCYVPMDICRPALEECARQLLQDYAALDILAFAAEYREALRQLAAVHGTKLILWLGSNLGNFHRTDAATFVRNVREKMRDEDRLLLGIDLRKDPAILERAYNDSQGVTAAFNLNLLGRINRELGGHFDLSTFRHHSVYNAEMGRIEMYLVSKLTQHVHIDQLALDVSFDADEAIHTENSYKFSPDEIDSLAWSAGLRVVRRWLDRRGQFSVNLLDTGVERRPTKA